MKTIIEKQHHPNGVLAYAKITDGTEYWYDAFCELIKRKQPNGAEEMYANNQCVYQRFVDGSQVWYDSKKNCVRHIDMYGREWLTTYNKKHQKVYEGCSDGREFWYNRFGNCIRKSWKTNTGIIEYWYRYPRLYKIINLFCKG